MIPDIFYLKVQRSDYSYSLYERKHITEGSTISSHTSPIDSFSTHTSPKMHSQEEISKLDEIKRHKSYFDDTLNRDFSVNDGSIKEILRHKLSSLLNIDEVPDPLTDPSAQVLEFGFYDSSNSFIPGAIIVSDQDGNMKLATPGHIILSPGVRKRLFVTSDTHVFLRYYYLS